MAAGDRTNMLQGSLYQGYLYSYPHKLAYRALEPRQLADVWRDELHEGLSLYAHVPFCEMRCGFCNLFTTPRPPEELAQRWLDAWQRATNAVDEALEGPREGRFASFAIGGGTPTWLSPASLSRVLDGFARLGADLGAIPGSVEVSPATVTPDHAAMLVERGVTRLSMGVQSLDEDEVAAVYRPQTAEEVARAAQILRDARVERLNLDLMYGIPGQTVASFVRSIDRVLQWQPEELFLYPLYVRPQTGLSRHGGGARDDVRRTLYRAGRDHLLDRGYVQRSMRLFCRPELDPQPRDFADPDAGLVGIGVGARSYTRSLHFSSRFAVRNASVRTILERWMAADPRVVDWGIALSPAEQRRRAILLRLLDVDGVSVARHGGSPLDDLPEMIDLVSAGLASWSGDVLRLTEAGLERSDQIGPWLVSRAVRDLVGSAEIQ